MFDAIRQAAASTACTVFETMFFISLFPADETKEQTAGEDPQEAPVVNNVSDGEVHEGETPGPPCPSVDHPVTDPARTLYKGEIEFRGSYAGRMGLRLTRELARSMAANFMGSDGDDIPDYQVMDVVGETCNVICGNLFSTLDKAGTHALTMPRTEAMSQGETEDGAAEQQIVLDFTAEGQHVRLDFQFDTYPEATSG